MVVAAEFITKPHIARIQYRIRKWVVSNKMRTVRFNSQLQRRSNHVDPPVDEIGNMKSREEPGQACIIALSRNGNGER